MFVHISKSFCCAGVITRKGQIKEREGRITTAWVGFRGGIYVYAMYFLQSEGMSTTNEELIRNSVEVQDWSQIGCDANMETEQLFKSIWFQIKGALIAAKEDEAGTYRASVAECSVTRKYGYFTVELILVTHGTETLGGGWLVTSVAGHSGLKLSIEFGVCLSPLDAFPPTPHPVLKIVEDSPQWADALALLVHLDRRQDHAGQSQLIVC